MIQVFHNTNYDFIGLRKWAYGITALIIIPGLLLAAIRGLNYSIEFTGGTLVQVKALSATMDVGGVRASLEQGGLPGAEITEFGNNTEFVIRARLASQGNAAPTEQFAQDVAASVRSSLESRYGAAGFQIMRVETVGPKVGGELRQKALIAILLSFAATLVYLGAGVESQEPTLSSALLNLLQTLGRIGLMLGYALTIALLAQDARWRARLAPFAAAGRMPLTNYLLQTALATSIFYGWGLGWWGRADTAVQIGLALALFCAVQVPLSVAWLSRFERGPLEALWRLVTYGRSALRRAPGSTPPPPRR